MIISYGNLRELRLRYDPGQGGGSKANESGGLATGANGGAATPATGGEGGSGGGTIVTTGTPEEVVKVKESYTGQFLKGMLK